VAGGENNFFTVRNYRMGPRSHDIVMIFAIAFSIFYVTFFKNLKMKNYIYLTTTKQTSLETKTKTETLGIKTKTRTWKMGSRDLSRPPRLKSRELQAWMIASSRPAV